MFVNMHIHVMRSEYKCTAQCVIYMFDERMCIVILICVPSKAVKCKYAVRTQLS
jgi:hypothetical protein